MRKTLLHILTIYILQCAFCIGVHAQMDTEFWFAAPSIVQEHDPGEVKLVIVAYDDDATISISQPAAGRTLMASRVVPKHTTYTYSIKGVTNYRTTVETPADGLVHSNGLLVKSTARVSVYYATTDPNSEVYTCKGRHGLGTEFVVPMQTRYNCGHNAYSSIEIVASQDGTTVQIKTLVPTNVSPTPATVTITLNRGETYAIRSLAPNTTAANHLGGTIITSDKPIAVNSTDDSAAAGGDLDLIGEQLVPSNFAGSHYILPSNTSTHEYAYFYAINDTARIYTQDAAGQETLVATVYPGQSAEYKLGNLQAYLLYTKDNTPFVCFHLTAVGGELSGTILPSLNCSGSQEVSYIPALSQVEAQVTVLTKTENIGSFLVNGSPYELPAMSFFPVPGDSTWSFCSCAMLTLPPGQTSFTIKNTTGVFHLGVLDNGGGACSYGYFSNYGEISLYAALQNDYYMAGDTVRFHLTGMSAFSHVTWTGPHGVFAQDEAEPFIANATELDAGMYIVSAEHSEGCEVAPDTIYVNVFNIVPSRTDSVCAGDSIRLKAMVSKPLTWYQDGNKIDGYSSRFLTYYPTQPEEVVFRIDGQKQGTEMIDWVDTLPLLLPSADSVIVAEYNFDNMIIGAQYSWSVTLSAPSANTVAPKLRFYVDDQPSAITAVPNGAPVRMSHTWTATSKQSRLRLVVISPRPERSLQIDMMSLTPLLTFSEERKVVAEDCTEPEPECPTLTYDSLALTLCDTVMPYSWRGMTCNGAGIYRDTLRTTLSNGVECDSIIYYLNLQVEECKCQYEFIAQRWDDVLFVMNADYNGGYTFLSYQWFCNGQPLLDQTSSYLYVPSHLQTGDTYEVEAMTTSGELLRSCPYVISAASASPAPAASKSLRNGMMVITIGNQIFTPHGVRID